MRPALPTPADLAICLGVCALLVLTASQISALQPFPNALDELGHYAYTRYIAETWDLSPALHLITQSKGEFYLNHPPGYYALMAPVFDACGGDTTCLRRANIPLGVTTVLLLYAAYRRAGYRAGGAGLLLALTLAVPVFTFMPAWLNNDNLAFLAGALATFAVAGRIGPSGRVLWPVLAAALLMAGVAKATALLTVATISAVLLAEAIVKRPEERCRALAWLAGAGVLAALPYLAFIQAYGHPVPNTKILDGHTTSTTSGRTTNDAVEFIGFFWSRLAHTLFDPFRTVTGGWLQAFTIAALWLAPAIQAIRHRGSTQGALYVAVTAALWGQVVVHMHHTWGYLGAVHIRYYMPAIPLALLAFGHLAHRLKPGRTA